MKRLFQHSLLAAVFLVLFVSCTEEQDFSQIDDLSVTPTLATGLFYFESDEQAINDSGFSRSFYTQTSSFDAFNEEYVAERLIEGTITYIIENTTSKRLQLTIEFLDEGGNVLDTESFAIEAESTEALTRDVFYGPGGKSLDILTTTSSLRFTAANLSDTTSVSSIAEPMVILRSAAEFIFRLK